MAVTPKHLPTAGPFTCEEPRCTASFSRAADRRRHFAEKHGPPTYCHVRNCNWKVNRKARFQGHLDKVHPDEEIHTDLLVVPSDFQPGTPPQSLASWQHPIEPDTSDTSSLRAHTASPPPQLDYPRASHSPTSTQTRIYRAHRLRRRPARPSSQKPTRRFSSRKQENEPSSPKHRQIVEDPVDAELMGMGMIFCAFLDLDLGVDLEMDTEDDGN